MRPPSLPLPLERAAHPLRAVRLGTLDLVDWLRGERDPLIPPRRLMFVGDGDFRGVGDEFRRHFVDVGGLRPDDDVLDVGCGVGRMAVGLTSYLTGHYEGFDIVPEGIRWCQRTITSRYPNFRFQVADLYNRRYNPAGRAQARDFRFPFDDESFDFVVATSVFTHLLQADRDHYVREAARVLRPGGTLFATFFLLNGEAEALIDEGESSVNFAVNGPGYRSVDRHVPEAALAFPVNDVGELLHLNGLEFNTHYGTWPGRQAGLAYQDIVIAWKPGLGGVSRSA